MEAVGESELKEFASTLKEVGVVALVAKYDNQPLAQRDRSNDGEEFGVDAPTKKIGVRDC